MNVETKRETLGAAAVRIRSDYNPDQTVIETQREMQKNYVDELIKCAKRGETELGADKHFYLCVQTRRERLIDNVIRSQFYARATRPEPAYDLTLYYYDPSEEKITFIWCIPDKDTVKRFTGHYYVNDSGELMWEYPAPPNRGEEQLAQFCKDFVAGTLI